MTFRLVEEREEFVDHRKAPRRLLQQDRIDEMSAPIYVDAYSGFKANERLLRFTLDDDIYDITQVEDHWYDPNTEYFRVRTDDGTRYILRYDPEGGEWMLQSGFDGAALLPQPEHDAE